MFITWAIYIFSSKTYLKNVKEEEEEEEEEEAKLGKLPKATVLKEASQRIWTMRLEEGKSLPKKG